MTEIVEADIVQPVQSPDVTKRGFWRSGIASASSACTTGNVTGRGGPPVRLEPHARPQFADNRCR